MYGFLFVASAFLFLVLRAVSLRPHASSILCAVGYASAPWGLACGLLCHRPSPIGLSHLPWRDALLVLSTCLSTTFLAAAMWQHAALDRPDLSAYRSRAMAVLR
jgi:hypothetical protein